MDFTLSDSTALRVLSKTVQVAAKLSDHVQFTPHAPSLHFRLLTPTHSTYAVFRFNQSFFSKLQLPPPSTSYKLSSRLLASLLKAPQTFASIRLSTHSQNRLCLTVVTHTALTKRFLLPLQDGRISSVRTALLRNVLHTSAAFLSDLLANFHTKLHEITLIPSQQSLTLSSFVDDSTNPSNAFLRTEITVDARQFDHHAFNTHSLSQGDSQANLTFMCRPLRFVVEFCDALDVPIRISYDRPASPLQLDIALPNSSGQLYFDALFVFASRVPLPERGRNQLNSPADHENRHQNQVQRSHERQGHQEQPNMTPVPVDAIVRRLPIETETENQYQNENQKQNENQNQNQNQQYHLPLAAPTPMRTPRRHGQQPLIPHPSQHPDMEEDEENQQQNQQVENQQLNQQQPRHRQNQQHQDDDVEMAIVPETPASKAKKRPLKNTSSRSTESPPPMHNHHPNRSTLVPNPSTTHMTPIPESDPVDREIPESDPVTRPARSASNDNDEHVDGTQYVHDDDDDFDFGDEEEEIEGEEGDENDEDDDEDFVAGTPPPDSQD